MFSRSELDSTTAIGLEDALIELNVHIRKIRLKGSASNNLLQLADVICGAVARSYKDTADATYYRKLISCRERNVEVWPK